MLPGAHAGAFGRAGAQTGEMLGLADRNDPTPPIRWRPPSWWGAVAVALGIFEIVFGAFRLPSEPVTGITFLVSGVVFVVLGIARLISRRRAPGSDGGTADHP